MLLEANDGLVDKINSHLDELSGVRKNLPPVLVESSISSNEVTKTVSTPGSWNKNSTPTVIIIFSLRFILINLFLVKKYL